MPPKSIWRSKDAQHFTLVHRSQRDPLIHDPEASSRVLAPTQRGQRRDKGAPISRSELEEEYKTKDRPNVGEAANYGVYYDDTEYDYMQHLRPIGGNYNAQRGGKDEEDDVDVVMLPGPKGQGDKGKGKAKAGGDLEFKEDSRQLDLPQGVLASKTEMERDWARGTQEEGGLRLDMDPHLRQVLEALDDEAFLAGKRRQREAAHEEEEARGSGSAEIDFEAADDDDGGDDDFDALFSEVIAGGEADEGEAPTQDDWRHLPPEGDESLYLTAAEKARKKLHEGGLDNPDLSLAERVALFKEGLAPGASGAGAPDAGLTSLSTDRKAASGKSKSRRAPSSMGGTSIFGDAPGKKSKPGSKARHAMSFYAPSADGGSTAWSMSSSAMERNAGLRNVDDGFDRMEQIYEQDDEEEDEGDEFDDDEFEGDDDGEGGYIREDFETILDEFLNDKEVVAGKVRQRLGGRDATGAEKLDILRKEVGQAKIDQWLSEREETQEEIDKDIEGRIRVVGGPPKDWDVETIQTTKTNVSNHPRLLSHSGGSIAGSSSSRSSFRPGTLSSNGSNGSSLHLQDGSDFESIPKVRVNKRTGVSEIVGWTRQRKVHAASDAGSDEEDVAAKMKSLSVAIDDDEEEDDGSGPPPESPADDSSSGEETETEDSYVRRETTKRDRNESKEDKKARKDAAKSEKQARKMQKSKRKEEFAMERKRQVKMDAGRIKDGGAADVRVGAGKRLN